MAIEAFRSAERNGFGIRTKVRTCIRLDSQNGIVPLSKACSSLDAYVRATDYLFLVKMR